MCRLFSRKRPEPLGLLKGLTRLHRAVITGKDTPYKTVSDLRGKTIGVSRMGSGSQIFASYMALREKWFSDASSEKVEPLDFKGESDIGLSSQRSQRLRF